MVGPRITVINIICPRPLALCNYSQWFNLSHKLWCTTARGYLSGWSCRQENQNETLPHPAVRALATHQAATRAFRPQPSAHCRQNTGKWHDPHSQC